VERDAVAEVRGQVPGLYRPGCLRGREGGRDRGKEGGREGGVCCLGVALWHSPIFLIVHFPYIFAQ